MEQKNAVATKMNQLSIKQFIGTDPVIEAEMMQLVIDSYLYGNQNKRFSNEEEIGVGIYKGPKEHVHLFINNAHRMTVEIHQGRGKITNLKNIIEKDVIYILPFLKCLGISDHRPLQEYFNK